VLGKDRQTDRQTKSGLIKSFSSDVHSKNVYPASEVNLARKRMKALIHDDVRDGRKLRQR
jgi:hypothetical protein